MTPRPSDGALQCLRAMTPAASPESDPARNPDDFVVDDRDPAEQWRDWVVAQLDEGREPNEVVDEMVAGGFDAAEAARMVARLRDPDARHASGVALAQQRAAHRSAAFSQRHRTSALLGFNNLLGFLGSTIGAVVRLFRPSSGESSGRRDRR